MANRRMFSRSIIKTDRFLDMSPTAQNLYFHLGMEADDDGFVSSPKTIMKISGTPDDDMKVLIAKKFVIPFENGVVVITDWKENNYIQSDRYNPTKYQNELKMLKCDDNVYMLDTQVRLGKDRLELGKSNIYKDLKEIFEKEIQIPQNELTGLAYEEKQKFLEYWKEKSPGGRKERWEMEKVFDVRRRWKTWTDNVMKRMKPKEYKKENNQKSEFFSLYGQ